MIKWLIGYVTIQITRNTTNCISLNSEKNETYGDWNDSIHDSFHSFIHSYGM